MRWMREIAGGMIAAAADRGYEQRKRKYFLDLVLGSISLLSP